MTIYDLFHFHFNLVYVNEFNMFPGNYPGDEGSHRRLLRET